MFRSFCKFVGQMQLGAKFTQANLASSNKYMGSSTPLEIYTLNLHIKMFKIFCKEAIAFQRDLMGIYNISSLKCNCFFVRQIQLGAKFTCANLASSKKYMGSSKLLQLYHEIACQDIQVILQIFRANLTSCQIYLGKFDTQQKDQRVLNTSTIIL